MDQQQPGVPPRGPDGPPGDLTNRRGFLGNVFGLLTGLIVALVGWPLASALTGPMYRRPEERFVKVPGFDTVPLGRPVKLTFQQVSEDAYLRETEVYAVWVIRHSATEATVFSPICPHLGCQVTWLADSGQFVCPCHGSVFSPAGDLLAGPAPRPLDTLPYQIEQGELLVKWERFQTGVARKVVA